MALNTNGPETKALRQLRSDLPKQVADWTPEQRQDFTDQSDRSMREQNSVVQPDELT